LVSLITVKRAYEDLEREGIIYRKQGIGTFVSEDGVEKSRSAQRSEVQERLAQAVADGTALGMTLEELNRIVTDIWNRHHAKEERK
ncbi:MAG TPA: GntR family transcriptional regulator, partial [Candidatus Hydrogenedentes bacterium]|nr:GntR family transcriptional regulator [Candidatus Hydrogenedentota bacterium]